MVADFQKVRGTLHESFTIENATIRQGNGTPAPSLGIDGDIYLQFNGISSKLFQKRGGAWVETSDIDQTLIDISNLTPNPGDVIKWSGTAWESQPDLTASSGSGATQLVELSDVNIAGLTINELLFSDGLGNFENKTLNEAGIQTLSSDLTTISSLIHNDGNVITSQGGVWTSTAPTGGGGGASALDDLTDVTLTPLTEGEILAVQSGIFVNLSLGAADIASVTDLTAHTTNLSNPHSVTKTQIGLNQVDNIQQQPLDSDLTAFAALSPPDGFSIVRSGGAWVAAPAPSSGATQLNELSDVTLASLGNNEILLSFGGTFINQTFTEADIASVTDLTAHTTNLSNPHSVTKTQIGLGNVTNDAQLKIASNLADLTNSSIARSNLGLVIGTDVQQFDTDLLTIANLIPNNGDIIIRQAGVWVSGPPSPTGSPIGIDNLTDVTITALGANELIFTSDGINFANRTLAEASIQVAGVALDQIIAANNTDGNFLVGSPTGWVSEAGAVARTSLGLTLGTDVQQFDTDLLAIANLTHTNDFVITSQGGVWVAGPVPGVGTIQLNDITDVTISAPLVGDTLHFNGTEWINRQDIFNVKDYGATGDSFTDDTGAINLAIVALAVAESGVLFFPAGEYRVTSTLNLSNIKHAIVAGAGQQTTIISFVGIVSVGFLFDLGVDPTVTSEYCQVSDMTLTSNQSTDTAIKVTSSVPIGAVSKSASFMRVTFSGMINNSDEWKKCIHTVDSRGVYVSECLARGKQNIAPFFTLGTIFWHIDNITPELIVTSYWLTNSEINFYDKTVFASANVEGMRIDATDAVACNVGFEFSAGGRPQVVITNCHISTYSAGINILGSAQTFITNNLIYARDDRVGSWVGIQYNEGPVVNAPFGFQIPIIGIIENNVLIDLDITATFAANGIVIIRGTCLKIEGNTFTGQDTDIWLQTNSFENFILDNIHKDAVLNDVLDDGTNNVIRQITIASLGTALADIDALPVDAGNFIVANGSTWVVESGVSARSSLGLGSIATQNANNVAILGGTIDGTLIGAGVASAGTFTVLSSTVNPISSTQVGNLGFNDTRYQAINGNLTDISSVIPNDGTFIVGSGGNFVGESGAIARASLGLTIGSDVQAWNFDLQRIADISPAANEFDIIQRIGGVWVVVPGGTGGSSGGVIGVAEDGDYTDGLFQDFVPTTPIGTAIDRFNEVLLGLAPPSPIFLADIDTNTLGVSGALSFDGSNLIAEASYTAVTGIGTITPITVDGLFPTSSLRSGIIDAASDIVGTLNENAAAEPGAFPAKAFDGGDLGILELEVNGIIVRTLDLSADLNAIDDGVNVSGFTLSAATEVTFPGSGLPFQGMKYRTGTFRIDSNDVNIVLGWNYARVRHIIPSGTLETNYIDWIVDANVIATVFSNEILDNLSMAGSKFISGIEYHTSGQAEYDITVDNAQRNTYSSNSAAIEHTSVSINCSAPIQAFAITLGNELQATIITNKIATITAIRLIDDSITAKTIIDRTVQNDLTSSGQSIGGILLDNASDTSTQDTLEGFEAEVFRIASNSDFTSASISANWNSLESLNDSGNIGFNDGLQIINSELIYPNKDFGIVINGPLGNPNYSIDISGERNYIRLFTIQSGSTASFRMVLNGSGVTFISESVIFSALNEMKVSIRLPSATGWMDAYKDFATGQFNDGDGARDLSNGNLGRILGTNWDINTGTLNTSNSSDKILLKITVPDGFTGNLSSIDWSFV